MLGVVRPAHFVLPLKCRVAICEKQEADDTHQLLSKRDDRSVGFRCTNETMWRRV